MLATLHTATSCPLSHCYPHNSASTTCCILGLCNKCLLMSTRLLSSPHWSGTSGYNTYIGRGIPALWQAKSILICLEKWLLMAWKLINFPQKVTINVQTVSCWRIRWLIVPCAMSGEKGTKNLIGIQFFCVRTCQIPLMGLTSPRSPRIQNH